jgi:hypothetical protein
MRRKKGRASDPHSQAYPKGSNLFMVSSKRNGTRSKRRVKSVSDLTIDEAVIFVNASQDRWNGRILVGRPKRLRTMWSCSVFAERVVESRIGGSTPLQALVLALQHLATMLFAFEANGGEIISRQKSHQGSALPGCLVFGRLWCSPEDLTASTAAINSTLGQGHRDQ